MYCIRPSCGLGGVAPTKSPQAPCARTPCGALFSRSISGLFSFIPPFAPSAKRLHVPVDSSLARGVRCYTSASFTPREPPPVRCGWLEKLVARREMEGSVEGGARDCHARRRRAGVVLAADLCASADAPPQAWLLLLSSSSSSSSSSSPSPLFTLQFAASVVAWQWRRMSLAIPLRSGHPKTHWDRRAYRPICVLPHRTHNPVHIWQVLGDATRLPRTVFSQICILYTSQCVILPPTGCPYKGVRWTRKECRDRVFPALAVFSASNGYRA